MVDVDYEYSDLSMSNEADELSIWVYDTHATGVDTIMLDRVGWDGGIVFPDPSGASLMLDPNFISATSNDSGEYWCAADIPWNTGTDKGTPGEANGLCSSYDHDEDGYSKDDGDCDDGDSSIYPGAPEVDSGVDNDCDGVMETGPTASAAVGSSSNAEECGMVYLDASGSSDPDGDTPLTYAWTLVSAPAGSALTSADISMASSVSASFVADAVGTYTFSLTVWDSGGAASTPTSLDVEVDARASNSTPTADAGSNQSSSASVTCVPLSYGSVYDCPACDDTEFSLDGTGSSDADGDDFSYSWSVTSGVGRIIDSSSSTTEIVLSGPTPTYGGSATNTVFISLTVTDCMGASSSPDTIAIAYTCSGS